MTEKETPPAKQDQDNETDSEGQIEGLITRGKHWAWSRVKDGAQWIRLCYMVLFGIFFYVCFGVLIWVLVAFQFLYRMITGEPNPQLVEFGAKASGFAEHCLRFLTYQTEDKPWPFSAQGKQ